eukprot:768397-Hanusia_phi.AAC.8
MARGEERRGEEKGRGGERRGEEGRRGGEERGGEEISRAGSNKCEKRGRECLLHRLMENDRQQTGYDSNGCQVAERRGQEEKKTGPPMNAVELRKYLAFTLGSIAINHVLGLQVALIPSASPAPAPPLTHLQLRR